MKTKILELEDLAARLGRKKAAGKRIVLCHGCFDLMHPGHIKHLQEAAGMGDVLVVTVTPDAYVDKGEGRPAFGQKLRAESLAALECVDFVAVNRWPTARETIRLLRPDIFVKGREFEELKDPTGKLGGEYQAVRESGGEIRFTHGEAFSSTALLNKFFRKP